MLCRRGLGCENSWSACDLFNNLFSNFIININHLWTGGLHPGGCALSKDSAGVKCTQWSFGCESGASWGLPSQAVGAVQAQKDQTCNITSSFRVQPLAIWALAEMSMLWGTWPW